MSSAGPRRGNPSRAAAPRSERTPGKRALAAPSEQPLERRILLTATLCLLAAGTVMVYSASSAPSLLEGGQRDGLRS